MIRIAAPAKINLFLEITGKRPDGYHTLETIFQTISFGDELTFKDADRLRLTCSNPSLPTDDRNLAMRAALGLQDLLKEKRGAQIHLTKKVPMGAGLGGGSSDAAAVLIGLQRLWKRRAPSSALHRLATRLGADVPFFLRQGLCAATGIGERLTPLAKLRPLWMVLVFPGFGVVTKDAYARVALPWADPRRVAAMRQALKRGDRDRIESKLFNRFESLVFPWNAALPIVKERLTAWGATATLMSGSGSSVFGLVASASDGRRVLRQARRVYPESWLVRTI